MLERIRDASRSMLRGVSAPDFGEAAGPATPRANDPAMETGAVRLWVEPPIGARRYHTIRVQGDMSEEAGLTRLVQSVEGLIQRPVFAMHLDLTGVTRADSKLLSVLVLLIRKAREAKVGVTIGLPEAVATMAVVYRVSELLRPHLV